MKKEDVLKLCKTDEQKNRVLAAYEAAEKFKKDCKFDSISSKKTVEAVIASMVKNYNKRKEADAKRANLKVLTEKGNAKILSAAADYLKNVEGSTADDIVNIINNAYKEDCNKKIDEQIAVLMAQKK